MREPHPDLARLMDLNEFINFLLSLVRGLVLHRKVMIVDPLKPIGCNPRPDRLVGTLLSSGDRQVAVSVYVERYFDLSLASFHAFRKSVQNEAS